LAQVFVDPVIAGDGRTYDREGITAWFNSCRERGLPLTSPWTRGVIDDTLRPNEKVLKAISERLRTMKNPAGRVNLRNMLEGVASIHQLRYVFETLDPLRDVLSAALEGWQPPQLVVIGQESSGKSSVLERLAFMPFFPRDENICTRLPIHVRLRNTEKCHPATLEVFNASTGQREEGPYVIPTEYGAVDVRDKMGDIIMKEHGKSDGVSIDR
jgi:hypothetical protein